MSQVSFTIYDYLVFGCMLIFSALIGIYYAFKDRNTQNTSEFLLGGRNLQVNDRKIKFKIKYTHAKVFIYFKLKNERYFQ
jgi:hypothetical protein